MHSAAESHVAVGIWPLRVELEPGVKRAGVPADDPHRENQQGPPRKRNATVLQLLSDAAIAGATARMPQGLVDHLVAITPVGGAMLPLIRSVQHEIHDVRQLVLRGVIACDEEKKHEVAQFRGTDRAAALGRDELIEQVPCVPSPRSLALFDEAIDEFPQLVKALEDLREDLTVETEALTDDFQPVLDGGNTRR